MNFNGILDIKVTYSFREDNKINNRSTIGSRLRTVRFVPCASKNADTVQKFAPGC